MQKTHPQKADTRKRSIQTDTKTFCLHWVHPYCNSTVLAEQLLSLPREKNCANYPKMWFGITTAPVAQNPADELRWTKAAADTGEQHPCAYSWPTDTRGADPEFLLLRLSREPTKSILPVLGHFIPSDEKRSWTCQHHTAVTAFSSPKYSSLAQSVINKEGNRFVFFPSSINSQIENMNRLFKKSISRNSSGVIFKWHNSKASLASG